MLLTVTIKTPTQKMTTTIVSFITKQMSNWQSTTQMSHWQTMGTNVALAIHGTNVALAIHGTNVALAIHGCAMDCQCDTKTLRGPLAGRGKQKQHLLNID